MKTCKIELLEPVDINGQTVTHVMLREPTAAEYMKHGEVSHHTRSETGQLIAVEDGEALEAYLMILITEPKLPLDRVGLADGMRLKDAVLDFFGNARQAGWKAAQPASSEISAGSTPAASLASG